MTFTPAELRVLAVGDKVIEAEHDAGVNWQSLWSAESKARMRARMGETAWRDYVREINRKQRERMRRLGMKRNIRG